MLLQERIRFYQEKEWKIPWRVKTNPIRITFVKTMNDLRIGEHWQRCELRIVVNKLQLGL